MSCKTGKRAQTDPLGSSCATCTYTNSESMRPTGVKNFTILPLNMEQKPELLPGSYGVSGSDHHPLQGRSKYEQQPYHQRKYTGRCSSKKRYYLGVLELALNLDVLSLYRVCALLRCMLNAMHPEYPTSSPNACSVLCHDFPTCITNMHVNAVSHDLLHIPVTWKNAMQSCQP